MAKRELADRIARMPFPRSFENGAEFDFDKVGHTFFGWTADGRAQLLGPTGLLQILNPETGRHEYPDKAQLLQLMAENRLKRRLPLRDPVRERARRRRLNRQQAVAGRSGRAAEFRMEILKRFDREQPALGDLALEKWRDDSYVEDEVRAKFGIWPCGSTIRKWVRERGLPGDRRWSDAASERGRKRGARRHRSVVAVAGWHAVECAKLPDGNAWASWCFYTRDHARLLAGQELSFKPAEPLPRPPGDPKPYCYERFRQMVLEASLPAVVEARSGRRGRRRKYGGGGASPEVTKLFEAVQLDAQCFPAIVLVDLQHRAIMGAPYITLSLDRLTKVCPGFHVSGSAPSTTSLMRTISSIWRPSLIPSRFVDKYPELALIGGAIDALEMDSGAENMSRAMEDLTGDAGFEMRIATPDEPMDKSDIERMQQTVQSYIAREMPSRVLDVRTRRELGLDPSAGAAIPFDVFVDLVNEAIATYHLQRHSGIGTTPLEAFLAARARDGHDWPADVDEFEEAAAEVEYDVRFDRTGFTLECGLRYSCHQETPKLLAEELAAAHGRGSARNGWVKRKVKFHADNLGRASIWSEARGRYVSLPCTRPDYATGLPLWLHLQILAWAGRTGRPVITEEEQIAARAGLVELVRGVIHALEPAQRALQFKLMTSPSVRTWLGEDTADLLRAPATVDGPPDAIHREFAASNRQDGSFKRPRSRRQSERDPDESDTEIFTALLDTKPRAPGQPPQAHARTPSSPSGMEKPRTAASGKGGASGNSERNGPDVSPTDAQSGRRTQARPGSKEEAPPIDFDYE